MKRLIVALTFASLFATGTAYAQRTRPPGTPSIGPAIPKPPQQPPTIDPPYVSGPCLILPFLCSNPGPHYVR